MSQDDAALYRHWTALLGWMQDIARERGLSYEKVSDFPDYIYRMERPFDLPTTVASAALAQGGQPLLIAAVSPRHVAMKSVQLRLMGGSKHWHLHGGDAGLLEGKRPFTKERLDAIVDGALRGLAPTI
ncbi:NADH-quinone oxidoreductase subunit 15 [Deinococcus pimensis]|uniref:NADH-quinone oxidoreductase subunit 15 n=1 Tax=Deinococcus pimensis TaxID=309888 RepID=UPI000489D097|nr:NADH-quinone oxidoreductase subunit 15 [Deinococcus pimensis]